MSVISITVNGVLHQHDVEPRLSLADFLRDRLGLTGTNVGCEQGVCGACTVLVEGRPMRACIRLAHQHDGSSITTVEGLAGPDGELSLIQQAFWENHAQQCGFCTPGFLTTTTAFLRENPQPTEAEVREHLQGNTCRCTGYVNIVRAVLDAAGRCSVGGGAA